MTDLPVAPEALLAQTTWLRRLTGELVRDPHAADDLAQDTYLAALSAAPPVRAGVRTWLEGIARKLSANRHRTEQRRGRRERAAARAESQPSAAEVCARFALHGSVVDAVMALDEPVRACLLLRFWEDLPPRAIAARLGVPVETARTRIKRGLARMRGRLDREHGDRRAWALPLIAMRPPVSTATATVTSSALLFGVVSMSTKFKVAAVAAVLATFGLIGSGLWSPAEADAESPRVAAGGQVAAVAEVAGVAEPDAGPAPERSVVATKAAVDAPGGVAGRVIDADRAAIGDVEICAVEGALFDALPNADRYDRERDPGRLWMFDLLTHASLNGGLERDEIFRPDAFGACVRTDPRGQFRFAELDADARVLAAWHPAYGCRVVPIPTGDEPITIVFEAWPRVFGRVTDTVGLPLAGVTVDVRRNAILNQNMQFSTDDDGRFRSLPVPPGECYVDFELDRYRGLLVPLGELRADREVAVELTPLDLIALRLVDDRDQPWTGARLAELGWSVEALEFLLASRAEPASRLDLALAGSPVRLAFDPESAKLGGQARDPKRQRFLSVWHRDERIAAVELASLVSDRVPVDVREPRPGLELVVDVALADPGAEVELELLRQLGPLGAFGRKPSSSTRGRGPSFSVPVPGSLRGETCYLAVRAPGHAEHVARLDIPLDGFLAARDVTLQRAECSLSGRVVDAGGAPVSGARLALATPRGEHLTSASPRIETDADGRFDFVQLARRDVRVFVQHDDYAPRSVVAQTDAPAPLVIRLEAPPIRRVTLDPNGVHVRVLDATGAPLMDARLVDGAVSFGRYRLRVPTDAQSIEAYRPGATTPCATAIIPPDGPIVMRPR